MGKPTTTGEFLDLFERSQLVEASLTKSIRKQVEASPQASKSPDSAAKILVKNQLITTYHAKQLLAGRYKGFYIDKYKIMQLLGAGGMGKVFLAEQITMQRLVAMKIVKSNIPKEMRKEVLGRFAREARAVAALQHPNIIRAYDYDEDDGMPYIVMEFVEGIDSAQQVINFGPIHWKQAVDYICQSCAALGHAHESGLVHRDIKPGNLLISTAGEVKLLDLGLVSCLEGTNDDSLTVDENQLGTIDYISPEQAIDSHNVDNRADIYSLGATFYTLISGQILFPGKTTAQKLLLTQTEEPTPIQTHVPDLPSDVAEVINKMLAKRPKDRFQSVDEVRKILEPLAVRKVPPYDTKAVKILQADIDPFMGRSPSPSEISVVSIDADKPDLPKSESDMKVAAAASMITANSPEPDSDVDFLDDLGDLDKLELPPPTRKKKLDRKSSNVRRKKAAKGNEVNSAVTMMAALGALGLAVVAVGYNIFVNSSSSARQSSNEVAQNEISDEEVSKYSNSESKPKEKQKQNNKPVNKKNNEAGTELKQDLTKNANVEMAVADKKAESKNNPPPPKKKTQPEKTKPKPPVQTVAKVSSPPPEKTTKTTGNNAKKNNNKNKPKPQGNPENRWKTYTKQLREMDGLVWYSAFEAKPKKIALPNDAKKSTLPQLSAIADGTHWVEGRWKSKGGVKFRGKPYSDHLLLHFQPLEQVDFSNGVSVALWFKTPKDFSSAQGLISRGPNYWRLHTSPGDGKVSWSINKPNVRNYREVVGKTPTNDEKWHAVVATYKPAENGKNATLQLFVDGELEGKLQGPAIRTNAKSSITIGIAQGLRSDLPFAGWMDEVAVFNRALNIGEAKQFFNRGKLEWVTPQKTAQKSKTAAVVSSK